MNRCYPGIPSGLMEEFIQLQTKRVNEIADAEAETLVEALELNSKSPEPILALLAAAELFIENGDFGPAAVTLGALYEIAGLDQEIIGVVLSGYADVAGFIIMLHTSIYDAFATRLAEIDDEDEEGFCMCDECCNDLPTLSDLHVPVECEDEEDDEVYDDCNCPSCRAARGKAAHECGIVFDIENLFGRKTGKD